MKSKVTLAFIILFAVIVVLSAYFVLQFGNFAYLSGYNRSVIIQVYLVNVKFLDDRPSIGQDFFMFNLTFGNPTNETLMLMRVEGVYRDGGYLIAVGNNETAEHIASGSSYRVLRMNKYITEYYTPPNVSLGVDPRWKIRYHLKLGPNAYKMTSTVEGLIDQTIQTEGPFNTDYDETYSTANTYSLSIVNSWIIGFEIVAIYLLTKERFQRIRHTTEKKLGTHDIMLSIIYAFQGVGVIARTQYLFWVQSVIPPAPPEFYYISGAGELARGYYLLMIYFAGFALLVVGLGLFRRARWARATAQLLSIMLLIIFFYGAVLAFQSLIWQRTSFSYSLALGTIFLLTLIANGIVLYIALATHNELKGAIGSLSATIATRN